MLKLFLLLLTTLLIFFPKGEVFAQAPAFISIVNPIRGTDFWELSENPSDAIKGQTALLRRLNLSATWLIRFDALQNSQIKDLLLENSQDEMGLFLEVTPSWTTKSDVAYRKSPIWHLAESVFLTGYEPNEREKLIDTAFAKFKETFGRYPSSVGAWYIDSFSLNYMQKKYEIKGALIVADQYSTDNYQIWGQYWQAPYYPSTTNTLIPAQTKDNKIPVVITQWAARDPLNGYGEGVNETTYSVQANDYLDFHNLTTDYFTKLLNLYLFQKENRFNQIVVGLENSYSWVKYQDEYQKQLQVVANLVKSNQVKVVGMSSFADWYLNKFPENSPAHLVVADDPLGSKQKIVWFSNPYYRAGWFFNREGSVFRDIRQYIAGVEEPCFKTSCKKVNFATFSTRVLDDVTYKQKLILDSGQVSDVQVKKSGDSFVFTYLNEVGKKREVGFMVRDIAIDGKISSIDGLILEAMKSQVGNHPINIDNSLIELSKYQETVFGFLIKTCFFIIFFVFGLLIPGLIVTRNIGEDLKIQRLFLSVSTGLVLITLVALLAGYLKSFWLIYGYILIFLILFIFKKGWKGFSLSIKEIFQHRLLISVIVLGTFFQALATARSGWVYDFGIGFWGPTGHDGVWHQALINQLIKQLPPENPALAGELLSNYHYLFDLLVATTARLSQIPVLDLLYRFYPILFSILLGLGSFVLVRKLSGSKLAAILSLYLIYFGGSFGWIVEYIKRRDIWAGESAFWANQPVSFNLNPPFAISLVLLIAAILLWQLFVTQRKTALGALLIIVGGSLLEFKVYAGLLFLGGLLLVALKQLIARRDAAYFKIFLGTFLLSLLIFLPQKSGASDLLVFSPFWFIHTMIDFSDRVGWERLTIGREAYVVRGEWLKFILAEGVGLLLFVVGNLGTRFIAIFSLPKVVERKFVTDSTKLLILFIAAFSFILPLLFIQKGTNWNTIQFFYYFLYFAAVTAGVSMMTVYRRLPHLASEIFLVSILLVTPISSLATFKGGFSTQPPARLPINEIEALSFLQKKPEGVVLTYPFDKNLKSKLPEPFPLFAYETSAYVAAFSGKSTFIEDEIQQEIFQTDYKKRLVGAKEFFSGRDPDWSRSFLEQNNIRYVYLLKLFSPKIDNSRLELKNIFENNDVSIYERSVYN